VTGLPSIKSVDPLPLFLKFKVLFKYYQQATP